MGFIIEAVKVLQHPDQGQAQILLVGVIFFMAFILTGGIVSTQKTSIQPKPGFALNNAPAANSTAGSKNNLQLKNLTFVTSAPSPVPTLPVAVTTTPIPPATKCTPDDQQICRGDCDNYKVTCENGTCTNLVNGPIPLYGQLSCSDLINNGNTGNPNAKLRYNWCVGPQGPATGTYCFAKPVIYLYPEHDTVISVNLSIPGRITKSIPEYTTSGWQNVLAHPTGQLEYQNQTYHELFYESEVNHVNAPKNGLVIPKKNLASELSQVVSRLGLNQTEKKEFLEYWLPEITQLPGNYVLFSVIGQTEKERIDGVHVTPVPNTRIEFLAYFKPLRFPIAIEPLTLPQNPPQRIGFTEVEWGGTIDTNDHSQFIF